MQLLFDNLAATIIGVAVFFILMGAYQQSQKVALQAASQEALWQQQVNFIRYVLRRDMAGVTGVEEFDADLEAGNPYTFHTRPTSGGGRVEVTYLPRHAKTLDDGTKLYQIERYVKKPGQPQELDGGSIATITGWSIEARNADGNKPSDLSAVRQLHVEMEAVAPFETNGERRRQHWEATYRPMQLQDDKVL